MTTSPSGFFMSDAVFARNLFGAMPMEQVSTGLTRSAKRSLDLPGQFARGRFLHPFAPEFAVNLVDGFGHVVQRRNRR